jgi:hypothetical protein
MLIMNYSEYATFYRSGFALGELEGSFGQISKFVSIVWTNPILLCCLANINCEAGILLCKSARKRGNLPQEFGV